MQDDHELLLTEHQPKNFTKNKKNATFHHSKIENSNKNSLNQEQLQLLKRKNVKMFRVVAIL